MPNDELARQATEAIAGFGYQLYQTVSAWMSLKPHEQLFVEIAEDFAVAGNGALAITQVKRTRSTVTLRSKGVVALIASIWRFQEANPGKVVSAAFLTTSQIGKEKQLSFPDGAAGLTYWRIGAREQADIEPIRTALGGLDLPETLKSFLKTATPDDIRNRIIRPIHWYTAAASAEELERDLEDRLVLYGQQRGVGAQDARNALNALIVELLRCMRRTAEMRFVTLADLVTVFERNTYRLVPPSLLSSGIPLPGSLNGFAQSGLNVIDAASIPLPPRATPRSDLVGELHYALVRDGISWLHGSSGLGKTTLALLIGRRQNALWQFADLRDLKTSALRLVLTRLASEFAGCGARGLILDDLPPDLDNIAILALRRVARAVADADGLLVVTSSKPPAPTIKSGAGIRQGAVRAVPYLTEPDIATMISQAGGDASLWSGLILVSSGGHPQLVDARIMGLRQRGWPADERLIDVLGKKKGELEEERRSVRARLLQEMDAASREMLFRLSFLTANFDRKIALVVASADPAVAQAGLVFDALIGPWIEQVGPERFRLSQLLRDSGENALEKGIKRQVQVAVLSHLLGERPFPADQLMQLFILAFVLRHVQGLSWFAMALVGVANRDKELFRRLAEEVSVFAVADRGPDELLFREDVTVSAMLRYAQLLVTCALEDFTTAARVLDRALAEIGGLDGERRANMRSLVLTSALMERALPLSPAQWLEMLQALRELPGAGRMLRRRPSAKDPVSGLVMNASFEEALFVMRATALTSARELAELINALGKLPNTIRSRYLAAAGAMAHSTTQIVASAWLSEVKRPDFDAKAAAVVFAELRARVASWNSRDLAVELACAQAVMLDEYASDKEAALAVLAEAQAEYPDNYRINRQRQKVYYRSGQHEKALEEFDVFAKALDKANAVDSAFALREAARSAAEIGEVDRAQEFFDRAWQALKSSSDFMLPMKAGLSGDCAILSYRAGRTDDAIALMIRALRESEGIDPTKGLKERYCILILVAALLWMRGADSEWPAERQALVIGMCSNPEPAPEIQERPLPQPLLAWYELAELEADVSDRKNALVELRQRTRGGKGLLPLETMLAARLLEAATRRLDIDAFLDAMRIYPRAVDLMIKSANDRSFADVFNMPVGAIEPIEGKEWQEPTVVEAVRSATLLFILAAVSQRRQYIYDTLREKCSLTKGVSAVTEPLFDLIHKPPHQSRDAVEAVAKVINQILDEEFIFNAADVFGATVMVVQLLAGHSLGATVAKPVLSYFRRLWQEIVAERTFSMRDPSATGPSILAAFETGATDRARLANVVLASEHAVRSRLSEELRATIRGVANVRSGPATSTTD